MIFNSYIGIDYSGAESPDSRLSGLQVYEAAPSFLPEKVFPLAAQSGPAKNWTRREIATWLMDRCFSGGRFIAGIDHAFSFPATYLQRYGLKDWDSFLADFHRHWPSDGYTYVEDLRQGNPRVGRNSEFRLTEKWTSSAKSVFQFDVQGSVAKSTHAGLPWLHEIRRQAGTRVHFWPFDGWDIPEGKHVIAEIYPAIFKNRYDLEGGSAHEQDAYAIAMRLSQADQRGIIDRYFHPPLTLPETRLAQREGWILGIC